ncbi:MAG TPA: helix-turn-helix transcriptional regulator [Streptosporangiaceae bacterium]|jgi:transcriptional regulator with XRE-family HTH domain
MTDARGQASSRAGGAAGSARRAELGSFLKTRRARLQPGDVGLAPGTRRRTSGLRREEVALLAGVGVTWYTWLEQGRPINASSQVLDAVARTLRLDGAERWHLYRLAEAVPLRSGGAEVVPDGVADVLRSVDPYPAVLINSRFDIVESNDAHEEMFADWHSMPCIHKNLLWCAVTEPRAREMFLNYDQEVPHMVARLRAAYARHVADPQWEENVRRLASLSPEFAQLWERHEVAGPSVRTRRFRHPAAGLVSFTVTELDVSTAPDLRVAVYVPADEGTRRALPRTRHGSSFAGDGGQAPRDLADGYEQLAAG